MIAAVECLPCLSRQATVTAQLATPDAARQQAGLGEVLFHLAMADAGTPLHLVAEDVQRTLARHTGEPDPYAATRRKLTIAAQAMLPALRRLVGEANDPWAMALRIATAGNLLEQARDPARVGAALQAAWRAATGGPLALDDGDALRAAARAARRILFLADNAGEVVWDRLLIEQLGRRRVTLVVRRRPSWHDATLDDVALADWPEAPRCVAVDEALPGYPAPASGRTLAPLLEQADLIVAKGADGLARLAGRVPPERRFHLFAPGCARQAAPLGVAVQALVVAHGIRWSPAPGAPLFQP